MKKRLLLMLVLALLLTFGVTSAAWAATVDSGECGDNLTWTLDSDGTLTISGNGAMDDYTLEWDYKANETNYTSTAPWGKKAEKINNIVIDSGVTSIGENAFYYLNNVENADIASSVYVISEDAFSYCTSLTNVDIPNGVKYIETKAFEYCEELAKVNIPATVLRINDLAFASCVNLTDINIENGVQYIENDVFYDCISLENLSLPASVKRIDITMFPSCESLTDITVDDNNTQYSSYNGVLYDKEKMTLLVYPVGRNYFEVYSETKIINGNALCALRLLSEIEIPDNVEEIDGYNKPFRGCDSLKKVTLSKNMTGNWFYLFGDCKNLTEIIFPDKLNVNDSIYEKTYLFHQTFYNCTGLKEIKIPENVSRLRGTFSGCENLETVYLPVSLKQIDSDTFARCYNLKKIVYAGSETQWGAIYIANGNNSIADAEIVYLNNSGATDPEDPDEPNKPTDPEQPDKPTNPDKPTDPEKPATLPITSRPGGLGSRLTVRVEGGHWLTVQVHRAGTIVLSSIQAPGTGMVTLTFSAAAGSVVQVWETENEMTFTNGVLNNKILATNVKNV